MTISTDFWSLLELFIEVIESETGYPVLIYDQDGRIIKASDKNRIGDLHAGAERIMRNDAAEYAVTAAEASCNPLVREGYSLPIFNGEEKVAGFGITGRLELARPIARTAVQMIEAWIREQAYINRLSASEKKYRNIFDQSLNGIFQTTPDGRFVTANNAMAKILGYPSTEELIATITNLENQIYVQPQSREKFLHAIRQHGYIQGFETQLRRLDGLPIDVRLDARLLKDPETAQEYIEGFVTDITERKIWENALTASERRFRDLFNEAPVMYVITKQHDNDWYILEANNTFLDLLGYRQNEVVGTSLKNYFSEESRKLFYEGTSYAASLITSNTAQECCLIAKNGRKVISMLRALPERDENGKTWGARSMFLDITARKKAEEETKRLQAALAQAQKMEAIGTLAGGIAHDFNNILSGVIGFSQLSLLELDRQSPAFHYIDQTLKAGMRAKDLVSQILAFSRQSKIEQMPLQVEPLIKESLKLLRATLPANIDIICNIDSPVDNIWAAPSQLQQIIMNLCTNAAHAMEERGGKLTVSLHQLDPQYSTITPPAGQPRQSCIRLAIEDTGCGIRKEDRDRIFDPYFTTKKKGKGTGLGLSVVHGIVADSGGVIEVESRPGKGTTFLVSFPTVQMSTTQPEEMEKDLPGGNENVLIVDDETAMLEIGADLLRRLGYRVAAFADGEEALIYLRDHQDKCDLLITDYMMPKKNGVDLYLAMREIQPALKAIVWTGSGNILEKLGQNLLPVHGYLPKPVLPDKMALKVREVLDLS